MQMLRYIDSKENRHSLKLALLTDSASGVTVETQLSKHDTTNSILVLDGLGVKQDEFSKHEKGSP